MKTSEILKAAKAKIEQGWTQNAEARTAPGGMDCYANCELAVCWCAMGAVFVVVNASVLARWRHPDINNAVAMLEAVVGGDVAVWNDEPGRTQDEVVAMFDKAIAMADMAEEYERREGV